MRQPNPDDAGRLRVGSLFSGYGGLDLAVEDVFNARTVWFSEINEPVAHVFAHHWTHAANLGDITTIDWATVPPVDILTGGFPCQDVSTVGKRAGLAPGTRSGLWAHMATAIEALQPQYVVIENVRGLLSAPARRATPEGHNDHERRNPTAATGNDATATLCAVEPKSWRLGEQPARPLRAMGAVCGDLADLGFAARWIGLPASLVGAPHHRFRIFILAHRPVPDSAGLGLVPRRGKPGAGQSTPGHNRAQPPSDRPRNPALLSVSRGDVRVDRRLLRRWGRYAAAIARWERITGRPAPAPAILNGTIGPRPAPAFVEWIMGLDHGWVTDATLGLTPAQQLTILGNGVVPSHAALVLRTLL